MAKILAFAGSNSSTSINYRLVKHTLTKIEGHETRLLNMVNYPFPMYSEDEERQKGFSNSLIEFKDDIQKVDGLIISVSEHNSNPSAYFKNVLDWLSRLERKFLEGKHVLLMATSPGKRGGVGALDVVAQLLPRFGATLAATYSLSSFSQYFDDSEGIVDAELNTAHQEALDAFLKAL